MSPVAGLPLVAISCSPAPCRQARRQQSLSGPARSGRLFAASGFLLHVALPETARQRCPAGAARLLCLHGSSLLVAFRGTVFRQHFRRFRSCSFPPALPCLRIQSGSLLLVARLQFPAYPSLPAVALPGFCSAASRRVGSSPRVVSVVCGSLPKLRASYVPSARWACIVCLAPRHKWRSALCLRSAAASCSCPPTFPLQVTLPAILSCPNSGPAVPAIASASESVFRLVSGCQCFLPYLGLGRSLHAFRHLPLQSHRLPSVSGQLVFCSGLAAGSGQLPSVSVYACLPLQAGPSPQVAVCCLVILAMLASVPPAQRACCVCPAFAAAATAQWFSLYCCCRWLLSITAFRRHLRACNFPPAFPCLQLFASTSVPANPVRLAPAGCAPHFLQWRCQDFDLLSCFPPASVCVQATSGRLLAASGFLLPAAFPKVLASSVPSALWACSVCLAPLVPPFLSAVILSVSPVSGLFLVALCFLPLLWVGKSLQAFGMRSAASTLCPACARLPAAASSSPQVVFCCLRRVAEFSCQQRPVSAVGLHCLSGYSLSVAFRLVFALGGCLSPILRCLQFCFVRGSGPAVRHCICQSVSCLLLVAMCFLPLFWVGKPLLAFRHACGPLPLPCARPALCLLFLARSCPASGFWSVALRQLACLPLLASSSPVALRRNFLPAASRQRRGPAVSVWLLAISGVPPCVCGRRLPATISSLFTDSFRLHVRASI